MHVEETHRYVSTDCTIGVVDGPIRTAPYMPIEQPYDSRNGGIENLRTYSREDIVGGMRVWHDTSTLRFSDEDV